MAYCCDVIFLNEMLCVADAILRLTSVLSNIIEPDFGLLDQLLRLGVLTRRQFTEVRSERTVYGRNDALLDLLTTEEQCNKFLTALQRTEQQHIINFIKQLGGQRDNDFTTVKTW